MLKLSLIMLTIVLTLPLLVFSHGAGSGGIQAKSAPSILAPFDIIHAKITTKDNVATFHMGISGKAGISIPTATGKLAGSEVFSYVWPTSIDSYEVGFEKKQAY